jgi:hypothetical protein
MNIIRNISEIAKDIKHYIECIRDAEGYTLDDLAAYLEINSLTLRNALYKNNWSDLVVTILKLKGVIPPELCYEYRKSLEKEKRQRRKIANQERGYYVSDEDNS